MRYESFIYMIYLVVLVALCSLHNIFFDNYVKVDVFLFSDKQIYLQNVVRDISTLVAILALLSVLKCNLRTKEKRQLTNPFIFLAYMDIIDYFVVYNQLGFLKIGLFLIYLVYTIHKIYKK